MTHAHDLDDLDHPGAIAIVGMAGRFPGAPDIEQFWSSLVEGVDALTTFDDDALRAAGVSDEDLRDPRYVRRGGALDGIESFDAGLFGMTALEARTADPQQRLFMETAWAALEHAGYAPGVRRGPIGVYAGASSNVYFMERLSQRPELMAEIGTMGLSIGNEKDYLATRTAYALGLEGPAITVQTACSSALVAVHLACQALLAGECDLALAGGVSVRTLEPRGYRYVEGGILSPDGRCRPFDADAAGTVAGDGVGVVVLKPLARAQADGDRIHALILGSAVNNDGSDKSGFTAPSVEGQAAVIREALAVADVAPEDIGYVEAHGTGTALGDPIEIAALRAAFGDAATPFCAIGAVKANIGHLDAAAGIAGLIKAALMVERGVLPPTPHFLTPNPRIDLEGAPFRFLAAAEPWSPADGVRRAGVSAFGIGGTNAHVVLAAPPASNIARSETPQPLLLSARTPQALTELTQRMRVFLRDAPVTPFSAIAHTTRVGRRPMRHRLAVVASSAADADSRLADATAFDTQYPRRLTFVFPESYRLRPGAAASLCAAYPEFRDELRSCARVLSPHLGLDIAEVLCDPSADAARLSRNEIAGPAAFALSFSLARLFESFGLRPELLAGAGIGESIAACLAGAIARDDALRLVALGGRLASTGDAAIGGDIASDRERFAAALSDVRLLSPTRRCVSVRDGAPIDAARLRALECWTASTLDASRPRDVLNSGDVGDVDELVLGLDQAAIAATNDPDAPLRSLRSTLARLWTRGHRIDWERAIPDHPADRVPIPGTVFARARHWIDAPDVARSAPALPAAPRIEGLQVPGWKRLPGIPAPQEATHARIDGRRLLWFASPDGSDAALIAHLRAQGLDLHVVTLARSAAAVSADGRALDPEVPEAFPALMASLQGNGGVPARIVYAWSLAARDRDHAAARLLCLDAPIQLVRALDAVGGARRFAIDWLTCEAQSVDGREHADPVGALIAGPARVTPLEYSRIDCRWIDTERVDPECADGAGVGDVSLCARLLLGTIDATPPVIALRGRHAWAPTVDAIAESELLAGASPIRDDSHCLVLGGSGGIGLAFADFLAARSKGMRISLFSRGASTKDDAFASRLTALRRVGAQVQHLAVDIADADALRAALRAAEATYGRIDLVLHAAGAAGEGLIRRADPDRLTAVLAPKLQGVAALLDALASSPPRLTVLCSSINASQPTLGQVGYCAANAYLDACAQKHSRPEFEIRSVNLSRWNGIGMAADDASKLGAHEIASMFEAMLSFEGPQLMLGASLSSAAPAPTSTSMHAIESPADAVGDFAQLRERIRALWQDLFGADDLNEDADFFDNGGDSLLALQMIARIQRDFGVEPALQALLAAATIDGMTQIVFKALAPPVRNTFPQADRGRPLPLSWSQQRLWFLDRLDAAASAAYHIAAGVRLDGALEVEA
ncbi:MAG: SDR family NAD(P)-dependent oxidoreductase, partial [Lysobacter sp.]|nr:SDR family NAD(P)-dependent oxidoreductase [Lysobacter sp.]